jgi:glycosyltransferase involved in cell wall biosynthesis
VTARPRVAFVVNGGPDSAMGERARAFADRIAAEFDVRLVFRRGGKIGAVVRMVRELVALRPAACYVFDLAAAGVAAAGLYKHLTGVPLVVDTGDAVVDLGRVLGRGRLGVLATRALETYALRAAARVVVRGSYHRELLARRGIRAEFIPDGVDVEQFAPNGPPPAAQSGRPLVVGLVGSSVWVPARQTCYGWELVELVRLLKDRLAVRGVLVGDGSGIAVLKRRCHEYGIADRVEFAGRVPYAELPRRLRTFDVCLSTQTDDVIGWVRTTGKLPLYLAAGRFVLASRVGEAARVLPQEMLVEFRGSVDPDYPARLADRVTELVARGTDVSHRPECVALARAHFDYDRLAGRVAGVLRDRLAGRRPARP